MADTVAQMSPLELRELIEDVVEQKLEELLGDPDTGLELRDEIKTRLIRQRKEIEAGNYGIPMKEVMQRLGLDS